MTFLDPRHPVVKAQGRLNPAGGRRWLRFYPPRLLVWRPMPTPDRLLTDLRQNAAREAAAARQRWQRWLATPRIRGPIWGKSRRLRPTPLPTNRRGKAW